MTIEEKIKHFRNIIQGSIETSEKVAQKMKDEKKFEAAAIVEARASATTEFLQLFEMIFEQ